jgi:hypothetical protein
MANSNSLKNRIQELFDNHGLTWFKSGTEWENMEYKEIEILNTLSDLDIPMMVKVAGSEARSELRNIRKLGIKGIIGPMIESEYALEKFIDTVEEEYENDKDLVLGVNLETKQAYQQLDSIVKNEHFKKVDLVIIGRLDLSNSFGIDKVQDPFVQMVTRRMTKTIQNANKKVSIGGFVNPTSALPIKLDLKADFFNTIHLVFDLKKVNDPYTTIHKAIEFEVELYRFWKELNPRRSLFYDSRIKLSEAKLKSVLQKAGSCT